MRISLLAAFVAALLIAPAAFAQYESGDTLVDVVSTNENLSTLATAVEAGGLAESLSADGPFTVFAPTNAAFETLPDGTLDSLLLDENQMMLQGILTHHVVEGAIRADDIQDGQTVQTLAGTTLTFQRTADGVLVNGVPVVMADVEASNGVAHAIGAVLMPEE